MAESNSERASEHYETKSGLLFLLRVLNSAQIVTPFSRYQVLATHMSECDYRNNVYMHDASRQFILPA